MKLISTVVFPIILHGIAGVAFKNGVKLDVLCDLNCTEIYPFSVFGLTPVLELAELGIKPSSIHFAGKGILIFNQKSLDNPIRIRIHKLYLPVFARRIYIAVYMVAVVAFLNDIPANRCCLVQLQVHQIGNLGGRRSLNNIAAHICCAVIIASHRGLTPKINIFPAIFYLNCAAANRIIEFCVTAILVNCL